VNAKNLDTFLLANVFFVATCALVYELLCGTLASYLLGDAVQQFSIVLGTYLFAMGIGAAGSKLFEAHGASRYVQIELVLALVGGLSVPALMLVVAHHFPLRPALYGIVFVVGALVGVELPLLVSILRRSGNTKSTFSDVVARALAYDYIGALLASLLFPVVLVPHLGLVRTSVLAGMLNAIAGLSAAFLLDMRHARRWQLLGGAVLALLCVALVRGDAWVTAGSD
jgi:spermidine synthase